MASSQSIYTCVDARGRKLTADRPIPECVDREQRELNGSGTVRRTVGPTLTANELLVDEERRRVAQIETNRRNEEKRRDRALLSRYPDKAAHDRARADNLAQFTERIRNAEQLIASNKLQRKKLDEEMEFFRSNPAKAPSALRRQLEENTASVQTQARYIADQEAEASRLNARFDEEKVRLSPMWQASASAGR